MRKNNTFTDGSGSFDKLGKKYIKSLHLASCNMTYTFSGDYISYFLACTSAL